MKLARVIKAGLVALAPIAVALVIWIYLRSNNLASLSEGMEPGFLVPETADDAIRISLIIWLPIALVLSVILSLIYFFVATKWRWLPWHFALLPIGSAVIISALAVILRMPFAVEATGEMLIIAIGFGLLIPWLSGI